METIFFIYLGLQIVMDSFALPVEGTETRVNAQSQAYEYMAAYIESAKEVGTSSFGTIAFCVCVCVWLDGIFILLLQDAWKMQSAGITVTLAMDVGCPVSMYQHRC